MTLAKQLVDEIVAQGIITSRTVEEARAVGYGDEEILDTIRRGLKVANEMNRELLYGKPGDAKPVGIFGEGSMAKMIRANR